MPLAAAVFNHKDMRNWLLCRCSLEPSMTIDRRSQDSVERILSSVLTNRNMFCVIQTRHIDMLYYCMH